MKLLVIAPYFYPKVGGLENYAWHICRGLKESYGWDIVAIASNHEKNVFKVEVIEGIKIYRLPTWFKLSNTPINLGWFIDIWKIIQKEKPNVVNGHTPVPFIADVGAIVSSILKIPFYLTYHNDLVKNNVLDILFSIYYSTFGNLSFIFSKRIIVTSHFYANNSKYLKKFKSKFSIIPPGVDLKKYKKTLNTLDNKIILFVGQLDKTHTHKGLSFLIKAMEKIVKRMPSTQLHVIGKGNNIDQYKNEANTLNVSKHIKFIGYVNDDNLIKRYQSCTVVVLPSTTDSEGFGMTLIEAGACGKPVVGTKVGGIPFVIKHNKTGLLISPRNSEELSEAVIRILEDKNLSDRLGKNGYEYVTKNFSWDKQVKKSMEVLL